MRNYLRLFTLLIAVGLVGCGATLPKIKPYKLDIQQGNVVTSEMLLKLRPGMTKSQVKFIMGTPLLVDSFHTNRWDYFYQLRKQGKIVSQRRVILDFESDLLKGVRGDVVPKGTTAEDVAKQLEKDAAEAKPAAIEDESADTAEPVVTLLDEPEIEATDATPASVLEVPIDAESAVDAAESSPTEILKEEVESEKTAIPETVKEEVVPEVPEAPKLPELKAVPETEMVKEVPVVEAAPAAAPIEAGLPKMPAQASDNKRVFRLDRNLDTTRIIPAEVTESQAPLQDSVVQELKENQDNSTTKAPSFFERMLEKIGF